MSAILLGAAGWTLADYFEAAVNDLPGDPAGFTVSVLAKIVSQSVASVSRRIFSQRGVGNTGWDFTTLSTNSSVLFTAGGGTAAANSPASGVAAADIGKLQLYMGVWDGVAGSLRLYAKRVQAGSGSALSGGYAPNTSVAPRIGGTSAGHPSDGIAVYGATYSPGIATLAQYQAQCDAVMASERIQHVPGLAGVLIDLTQDFASGVVASTLTDRGAGGKNFTKAGNPALSPQYARAWAW